MSVIMMYLEQHNVVILLAILLFVEQLVEANNTSKIQITLFLGNIVMYLYLHHSSRMKSYRLLRFCSSARLRADYRFAPSQWETALLCNNVSHWLGASLESALATDDLGTSGTRASAAVVLTNFPGLSQGGPFIIRFTEYSPGISVETAVSSWGIRPALS